MVYGARRVGVGAGEERMGKVGIIGSGWAMSGEVLYGGARTGTVRILRHGAGRFGEVVTGGAM